MTAREKRRGVLQVWVLVIVAGWIGSVPAAYLVTPMAAAVWWAALILGAFGAALILMAGRRT